MTDAPEPHPVGRHVLGPHVVGKRIVVRHLIPDGRATDVLGTCLSWSDTELVIDRDGAGPVTIRVADVVTGKPVPPRPSVRHKVSPREVEGHTNALWPGMETANLGEWLLRRSPPDSKGRPRRRANSALAMGDPDLPLADASNHIRAWYADRGQDPLVLALADSEIEAALLELGWQDLGSGAAHCQLASVAQVMRSIHPAPETTLTEVADRAHARIGADHARGRATLDDEWVVLDEIITDTDHRRAGLATAVIAELLDWAASRGATTAMLQVETDNPGAIRLYEGIGFVTHHTYRYLRYGVA